MDARFYQTAETTIDIERLAKDLVDAYYSQGYQAQFLGNGDQLLIQFKKGSDLEALIGLQAALSLTMQRNGRGVLVTVGQQKWIDKAAVGAVSFIIPALWPLAITAGLGAIRQSGLAKQIFALLDTFVRQQYPDVQINPNAVPHF
ncbi:hypothetical protein [Tengunoibacter tsumagoiensis]|uniref:Uncharacterized protein n=1 Tax=Tengunoibacter tsumagoiensis TaxID=2014871 RepID=A0A401ZW89_9CHLR|nr:hypothetical protein [Tengunoibacter tsumagoiensis]GCE11165.1 hypothetical protein KTT_10240 [Tengunoibacter tsumagoiensis]